MVQNLVDSKIECKAFDQQGLSLESAPWRATYGGVISFKKGENSSEIKYEMTISSVPNKSREFVIERDTSLWVDNQSPHTSDEFLFNAAAFMYPLIVKTNMDGTLFKVLNFETIVQRWEESQDGLRDRYQGAFAEKVFRQISVSLSNHKLFMHRLRKDWFLELYFSPLYINYSRDFYKLVKRRFPVNLSNVSVQYDLKQSIFLEKGKLRVVVAGDVKEERSFLDLKRDLDTPYYALIEEDNQKIKGTCDIKYLIDKNSGRLEGYYAVFKQNFTALKEVNVSFFQKEVIFQEQEKEDQPEAEEKKKYFFSNWFN